MPIVMAIDHENPESSLQKFVKFFRQLVVRNRRTLWL
jgi:hypothetical protein